MSHESRLATDTGVGPPPAATHEAHERHRHARIGYERPLFAWLLSAPALAAIFALAAYPILQSAWLSLHKYNLKRPRIFEFIGLDNFVRIVNAPEFWSALLVTVEFTFLVVTAVVVLGVLIALLLNLSFPGRGWLRTLILLPWAIPPVVNGLMWQWIYDSKIGALNGLLVTLGVIPEYRGWLSEPTSALLALAFADTWNVLPLAVILLLAALQKIPSELYETAKIDGAGPIQLFRYVTFPWIAQTLLVVLILQTLSAIRVFDVIYVLTAGGPGDATTTLTWKTYLTTFENLDYGLGNAYAWVVSLITFGFALVYFRVLYRRGDFEA
jgi:multiple sugar transport system permease protein